MQNTRERIQLAYAFEDFVEKIFRKSGYKTQLEFPTNAGHRRVDLVATDSAGNSYCIEVKLYSTRKLSGLGMIKKSIDYIYSLGCELNMTPVLVMGNEISEQQKLIINQEYPSLIVIDIRNLLYSFQNQQDVRDELVSLLSYTVEDITPVESPINLGWMEHSDTISTLLAKFDACIAGRSDASKYEKLCCDLLKVAFSDDLALWSAQQNSNNDLYRFDLLCRIKDNNEKTFWSILERYFNSKYVIFEFKNYSAPITQKEIYTTEKYLYKRALRSVALIIARNGFDNNAQWAAKGCLRENGKLIILLNNDDLRKMVIAKTTQDDPTDYLLEKLDTLLSELEK